MKQYQVKNISPKLRLDIDRALSGNSLAHYAELASSKARWLFDGFVMSDLACRVNIRMLSGVYWQDQKPHTAWPGILDMINAEQGITASGPLAQPLPSKPHHAPSE